MADIRESFATLEDSVTGAGEALSSRIEGEAAASQNGAIGFAFKDSSGNVVLPQLNSDGSIATKEGAPGAIIDGSAKVAGALAETDVVTLTLALTKVYQSLEIVAGCFKETVWRIVHIDDVGGAPTETEIGPQFVTGPGQYTFSVNLDYPNLDTTGGTGVQNLVLRGENTHKASDYRGYMGIKELA